MKSKLILLLLVTVCLSGEKLWSQDAKADFEKVFQKYSKAENLSLKIEAYAEGQLTFEGSFKKRGEQFYTKAWGREVVVKGKEMLVVNHEDHKIALGKMANENISQLAIPEFSIDSLEAYGGKISFVGKENNLRKYSITMPDALVHTTQIYLNDQDLISRMIYHYQALESVRPAYAKLEIFYSNISFEIPDASFFDEKKYYRIMADGSLRLNPTYKDYTIKKIDYLSSLNHQF